MQLGLDPAYVTRTVAAALAEDLGPGDVTTLATIPAGVRCTAELNSRVHGVVAGLAVAIEAFRQLDPNVEIDQRKQDGDAIAPGDLLLRVRGDARAVLSAERVALNFTQRMSGVDLISVGALTHSAPALDLGLDFTLEAD
jgi:nicotinate-nucleotide pyrophosphorylase (carboxylating)